MKTRTWFLVLMLLGAAGHIAPAQSTSDTARIVTMPLTSAVFANTRTVRVYLPPGYFDPGTSQLKYPVLLMADGFAVFSPRSWNAPAQLDSLIRAKTVAPLILVGVDNAASIPGVPNPSLARSNEYLPYTDPLEPELPNPHGRRFPEMLWNEVVPAVQKRFRIDTSPQNVVVGGSSAGAIAALFTATISGQRLGGLLLESPPLFLFDERLTADLAAAVVVPARIYVGIGTAETSDSTIRRRGAVAIQRFLDTARVRGIRTRYNEVLNATHGSQSWRARLPAALKFLFPNVR